MPRLHTALLVIALGGALCTPALAQWKWRDATGRVQYSDLPPPAGVSEAQILQRPNAAQRNATPATAAPQAQASAPSLPAAKTVEPELEAKRKQAEQEKASRQKAEDEKQAASRAENCSRAKSHLRALDDGIRLARVNAKGEREILDDKQRADETARTRALISAECR